MPTKTPDALRIWREDLATNTPCKKCIQRQEYGTLQPDLLQQELQKKYMHSSVSVLERMDADEVENEFENIVELFRLRLVQTGEFMTERFQRLRGLICRSRDIKSLTGFH